MLLLFVGLRDAELFERFESFDRTDPESAALGRFCGDEKTLLIATFWNDLLTYAARGYEALWATIYVSKNSIKVLKGLRRNCPTRKVPLSKRRCAHSLHIVETPYPHL